MSEREFIADYIEKLTEGLRSGAVTVTRLESKTDPHDITNRSDRARMFADDGNRKLIIEWIDAEARQAFEELLIKRGQIIT